MQRILDSLTVPAYVRNGRGDVVATNPLGRALFADAYEPGGTGFNMARFLFLDPRSQDFFVHWETVARDSVAALRIEAGRNPHDRALSDLVGELSTRSEEFATWWATHNVKIHPTATKTLHHPIVGDLELTGEALHLPGDPDLILIVYTVEPNSPSAHALDFLASWSTQQPPIAPAPQPSQDEPYGMPIPEA